MNIPESVKIQTSAVRKSKLGAVDGKDMKNAKQGCNQLKNKLLMQQVVKLETTLSSYQCD